MQRLQMGRATVEVPRVATVLRTVQGLAGHSLHRLAAQVMEIPVERICRKCSSKFNGRACPACVKARQKAYREKNRDEILRKKLEYRIARREILAVKSMDYYYKNKDECLERMRAYKIKNNDVLRVKRAEFYDKNKQKILELQRSYYIKNRLLINARNKRWNLLNSDRKLQSDRLWSQKNRDKRRAAGERWRKAHLTYRRVSIQNYRAKKRENGGKLSKDIASKLYKLQKGRCACCGLPLGSDYHLDHIMPVALGGANEDWNIQLLRALCNTKKGAKHPVEYMQSLGKLL